jgi:murein DD-endopeptidase MepM/ murein hydrolase activator NlpD
MTATPNQTAGCPPRYIPGNDIEIDHGNGQYSVYYHLKQNSIVVSANQHVSAGQMLATSGNSGDSCGAHLHYQLQNIGGNNLTSGHSFNRAGSGRPGIRGESRFKEKSLAKATVARSTSFNVRRSSTG